MRLSAEQSRAESSERAENLHLYSFRKKNPRLSDRLQSGGHEPKSKVHAYSYFGSAVLHMRFLITADAYTDLHIIVFLYYASTLPLLPIVNTLLSVYICLSILCQNRPQILTWLRHGPGLTGERHAGIRWQTDTRHIPSLNLKLIEDSSGQILHLCIESTEAFSLYTQCIGHQYQILVRHHAYFLILKSLDTMVIPNPSVCCCPNGQASGNDSDLEVFHC